MNAKKWLGANDKEHINSEIGKIKYILYVDVGACVLIGDNRI